MFVCSECLEAVVLSVVVVLWMLELSQVALVQLDGHQGGVGHLADMADPTLTLVTHWQVAATIHRLHTTHTIQVVIDNFIDMITHRVSITGVVVVM